MYHFKLLIYTAGYKTKKCHYASNVSILVELPKSTTLPVLGPLITHDGVMFRVSVATIIPSL